MSTITFLTSGIFQFTASAGSGSVKIECWGAGGHGSSTGNGGSGGTYAATSSILNTGSFKVIVGTATSTDGAASSVTGSGIILVKAAGGKQDGTLPSVASSIGSVINLGGAGGVNSVGYASYDGSGGGGAGGATGAGAAGSSTSVVDPKLLVSFYYRDSEGANGGSGNSSGGTGGRGAYYESSVGPKGIRSASPGSVPGGGGGGSYDYGLDSSAAGANGKVVITF